MSCNPATIQSLDADLNYVETAEAATLFCFFGCLPATKVFRRRSGSCYILCKTKCSELHIYDPQRAFDYRRLYLLVSCLVRYMRTKPVYQLM